MGLLLEADPSEKNIEQYLSRSECYAAKLESEIVGVCLVAPISPRSVELYNIAVNPDIQAQGVGGQLLSYVLEIIRNAKDHQMVRQVELSTGTFGHQLSFYQRHGFRVDRVVRNHFLDNYSQPIYENGIQHKDMLRLVCQL
jgi:ribosomal protein S18 acetylase RimI-like enzyme